MYEACKTTAVVVGRSIRYIYSVYSSIYCCIYHTSVRVLPAVHNLHFDAPYPRRRRRRLVSTPAPPPAAPSAALSELLPCPPPLAPLRPTAPLQRGCRSCRRHAPTEFHDHPFLAPRTGCLRCCCCCCYSVPLLCCCCCCWMEILAYEP